MGLLQSLLIILVSCWTLGFLAAAVRQPKVVGEILAGVLLGPAILNWVNPSASMNELSKLASYVIVIAAGLELEWTQFAEALLGHAPVVAILNLGIPLLAGIGLGLSFGHSLDHSLVLALCMSVTALPVAIRILESFGALKTRAAHVMIASAVINDALILFGLGFLLRVNGGNTQGAWGPQFLILAFLLSLAFGHFFKRAAALVTPTVRRSNDFLLGPVFFAAIGLALVKLPAHSVTFLLCVIGASIITKIGSGWLGGILAHLTWLESLEIGVVSNSRGVMGLVIAKMALDTTLISPQLFSILVLMDLATTIITPVLYRLWIQKKEIPWNTEDSVAQV